MASTSVAPAYRDSGPKSEQGVRPSIQIKFIFVGTDSGAAMAAAESAVGACRYGSWKLRMSFEIASRISVKGMSHA